MCYLRRPHVNKSGKPWSLPDPYIILSPHHPARHLGHLHAAAGHGLHHLARVVELLHQAVDVGHRRAAEPLAMRSRRRALMISGRSRSAGVIERDDRLGLLEHVVRNVHVLEHLAHAGEHRREVLEVAHLLDLLNLRR